MAPIAGCEWVRDPEHPSPVRRVDYETTPWAKGMPRIGRGAAIRLFRTDPRVIAIVDRVCDARLGDRFAEDRRERAFAIAWNRDEGGLRTEAIERAHAMCEAGEG